MSDKHEFDSEISTDNSISVPEHLQDKFPPASKVKVGISHNKQEQAKPEHFYRYQNMPTDIHRLMDLFVYNKLWFASTLDLNDPFDFQILLGLFETSIPDTVWEQFQMPEDSSLDIFTKNMRDGVLQGIPEDINPEIFKYIQSIPSENVRLGLEMLMQNKEDLSNFLNNRI